MKELLFSQSTPNGTIKGVLRILREKLYFRYSNSEYANKVIEQYREKGISITFSAKKDWILVDLFKDHETIKLRDKELDLLESNDDEIEQFLLDFYISEYKRLGYYTEVI